MTGFGDTMAEYLVAGEASIIATTSVEEVTLVVIVIVDGI